MAQGDDIPATDDGAVYGFTLPNAQRIGNVVKRIENQYYNGPTSKTRWPVIAAVGGGLVPAQTPAAGVGAGTFAAPVQFTATLLNPIGGGPGMATGLTTPAYNQYATALVGNKFCWLVRWTGHYYVVTVDC
jgi:hypothetical protein